MSASSSSSPSSAAPDHSIIGDITVYNAYHHHLSSIPAGRYPAPFPLVPHIDSIVSSSSSSADRIDRFLYAPDAQFQLILRTGPLVSSAYHVQSGESWLYMLSGLGVLRIIDGRTHRNVELNDGECFLLPSRVPSSLQLAAGAKCIIMNRARIIDSADSYPHFNKTTNVSELTHINGNAKQQSDEDDAMLWMCPTCGGVACEKKFQCVDYCKRKRRREYDRL